MSFNIMCESSKTIDWSILNQFKRDNCIDEVEIYPMPGLGIKKGDAFGLCIPLKNVGIPVWKQLRCILEYLLDKGEVEIYNLYSGERVTKENMESLRAEVT